MASSSPKQLPFAPEEKGDEDGISEEKIKVIIDKT